MPHNTPKRPKPKASRVIDARTRKGKGEDERDEKLRKRILALQKAMSRKKEGGYQKNISAGAKAAFPLPKRKNKRPRPQDTDWHPRPRR